MPRSPRSSRRAFSLIEVVLALGVVAGSVLTLIGLMSGSIGSAREIALQQRAINATGALDGALQNPTAIAGAPIDASLPSTFDRLYKLVAAGKSDNDYVDFLYTQKAREGIKGTGATSTPAIPALIHLGQSTPKLDEVQSGIQNGTGVYANAEFKSFMRLRVRVSKQLDGKGYKLDKTTYELAPSPVWSSGTALPPSPDDYGLAYLPLTVEVFPCDFTEATDPASADPRNYKVQPLITLPLVINR